VQLRFTEADTTQTPAKGRVLDHMSFDVKDLEAFIKTLEANNVKLDSSCTVNEARIGIAFVTDPGVPTSRSTSGLPNSCAETYTSALLRHGKTVSRRRPTPLLLRRRSSCRAASARTSR
jgi:hypothetical protein